VLLDFQHLALAESDFTSLLEIAEATRENEEKR
jgi:hypothetical protein